MVHPKIGCVFPLHTLVLQSLKWLDVEAMVEAASDENYGEHAEEGVPRTQHRGLDVSQPRNEAESTSKSQLTCGRLQVYLSFMEVQLLTPFASRVSQLFRLGKLLTIS